MGFHFYTILNSGIEYIYFFYQLDKKKNENFSSALSEVKEPSMVKEVENECSTLRMKKIVLILDSHFCSISKIKNLAYQNRM